MKRPIKLMIADDHQLFIDGVKALLEDFDGLEVVGETTGAYMVRPMLKTLLPDIILLNIDMSGMDGIETTEYIVKHYPTVKVLGLTMDDDPARIDEMLKAGVKGYLVKSTTKDELFQVIDNMA